MPLFIVWPSVNRSFRNEENKSKGNGVEAVHTEWNRDAVLDDNLPEGVV